MVHELGLFALSDYHCVYDFFVENVRFLERSPVTIVILIDLGIPGLDRFGGQLWKFSLELYQTENFSIHARFRRFKILTV